MSEKQGALTPELEAFYAEKLDEAVKLKGLLEIVDGYFFKVAISIVDNTLVDKVRDDVKVQLTELALAGQEGDLDRVEEVSTNILNTLIDIPVLDEGSEYMLFRGAVLMLVAAIKKWLEKEAEG